MSDNTPKIEEGILDSEALQRKLWKWRYDIIRPSIFLLAVYLFIKFTHLYELKYGADVVLGYFIAAGINTLTELKPKYIYKFSIEAEHIDLFLVGITGKRKTTSIRIDSIIRLKYKEKNFWRKYGKIWFHLTEDVKEYHLIDDELGAKICNKINVETFLN